MGFQDLCCFIHMTSSTRVTKRSLLDYVLAVFAQVVGEGVKRNDERCGYCYGEIDPPEQSMPVLCFIHEYIDRRRKRTIRF